MLRIKSVDPILDLPSGQRIDMSDFKHEQGFYCASIPSVTEDLNLVLRGDNSELPLTALNEISNVLTPKMQISVSSEQDFNITTLTQAKTLAQNVLSFAYPKFKWSAKTTLTQMKKSTTSPAKWKKITRLVVTVGTKRGGLNSDYEFKLGGKVHTFAELLGSAKSVLESKTVDDSELLLDKKLLLQKSSVRLSGITFKSEVGKINLLHAVLYCSTLKAGTATLSETAVSSMFKVNKRSPSIFSSPVSDKSPAEVAQLASNSKFHPKILNTVIRILLGQKSVDSAVFNLVYSGFKLSMPHSKIKVKPSLLSSGVEEVDAPDGKVAAASDALPTSLSSLINSLDLRAKLTSAYDKKFPVRRVSSYIYYARLIRDTKQMASLTYKQLSDPKSNIAELKMYLDAVGIELASWAELPRATKEYEALLKKTKISDSELQNLIESSLPKTIRLPFSRVSLYKIYLYAAAKQYQDLRKLKIKFDSMQSLVLHTGGMFKRASSGVQSNLSGRDIPELIVLSSSNKRAATMLKGKLAKFSSDDWKSFIADNPEYRILGSLSQEPKLWEIALKSLSQESLPILTRYGSSDLHDFFAHCIAVPKLNKILLNKLEDPELFLALGSKYIAKSTAERLLSKFTPKFPFGSAGLEKNLGYNGINLEETMNLSKILEGSKSILEAQSRIEKKFNSVLSSPFLRLTELKVDLNAKQRELNSFVNGVHRVYPKVKKVFSTGMQKPEGKFLKVMLDIFHGTDLGSANMISTFGFSVSKVKVGRSLGSGVYFAPNIDKSCQYLAASGFSRDASSGVILRCDYYVSKSDNSKTSEGRFRTNEIAIPTPIPTLHIKEVYLVETAKLDFRASGPGTFNIKVL